MGYFLIKPQEQPALPPSEVWVLEYCKSQQNYHLYQGVNSVEGSEEWQVLGFFPTEEEAVKAKVQHWDSVK